MFVLDTNVVSELRKAKSGKANQNVVNWANSVPAPLLFISAVTVPELEIGVRHALRRDPEQGRLLRTWLDQQVLPALSDRVLAFDTAVAVLCAGLHVPEPQSERDALIAATAKVHSMTVVTRNTGDFEKVGVPLINPWLPATNPPHCPGRT